MIYLIHGATFISDDLVSLENKFGGTKVFSVNDDELHKMLIALCLMGGDKGAQF